MISSYIEGRVRIRHNALKDLELMSAVLSAVQGEEGILHVSANPKIGSLLVLYDPDRISREKLLMAAKLLEAKDEDKACSPRSSRREARRRESLLLGSVYGLTLLSGLVGGARLHVATAGLFTLLAFKHLYDRRKCL